MIDRDGRIASGRVIRGPLFVVLATIATLAGAQLPSEQVPSLAPMIEKVSPAVVNISVSGTLRVDSPFAEDPFFRRFFPDNGRPVQSAGSGVIVDASQGYILTNHHVVANADRITVTLFDDRSLEARVIGTDEDSDIAVLQIDADGLSEIELGDSDGVRVGDFVVAIGNPFGLSHTVTSGIVSGLGRSNITPYSSAYEDYIQTDASINPGNSGGALVSLTGELIGINSAILSRGGGNIGIGFAIPVNLARYVMEQLIEHGVVSRGLLGVVINSVTPEIAASHGLAETSGALVSRVAPNSAAAKAGLRPDDVIISVNGKAVHDAGSLRNAIGLLPPGEQVTVGFFRDGREQTVEATLGAADQADQIFARAGEAPADPIFNGLDLVVAEGASTEGGLLVTGVAEGSLAAQRGLRSGDVITRINSRRVHTLPEAVAIVQGAADVVVEVRRDGRTLSVELR
ncbi:MAG TPA: Do family serine endopeptidase [Gammaproteobacteria bacterium]